MARRRKSLDEQIHTLDGQIEKQQSRLDTLLQQKKELISKKKEEEVGELFRFMKDNNMSAQDIYNLVEQNKGTEQ